MQIMNCGRANENRLNYNKEYVQKQKNRRI